MLLSVSLALARCVSTPADEVAVAIESQSPSERVAISVAWLAESCRLPSLTRALEGVVRGAPVGTVLVADPALTAKACDPGVLEAAVESAPASRRRILYRGCHLDRLGLDEGAFVAAELGEPLLYVLVAGKLQPADAAASAALRALAGLPFPGDPLPEVVPWRR